MAGLPVDHPLGRVYRFAAGLAGVALLGFGVLGFTHRLAFLSTHGASVAGLSSNGLLSLLSVVVGLVLIVAAVIGGNVAAMANLVLGGAFLASGLVNLALLRTSLNLLAFRMPNVIFSFVVGLLLITFGLYGRTSGAVRSSGPAGRPDRAEPPGSAAAGDDGDDPKSGEKIATG